MNKRRGFNHPDLLSITNPGRLRLRYWLKVLGICTVLLTALTAFLWLGATQYAEYRASQVLRAFEEQLGSSIVIDGHSIGMNQAQLTDVSIGNGTLAFFHKVMASYRLTPFGRNSAITEEINVDDFRIKLTNKSLAAMMAMIGKSHRQKSTIIDEPSKANLPQLLNMNNGTVELHLLKKGPPILLRGLDLRVASQTKESHLNIAAIETKYGSLGQEIAGKVSWKKGSDPELFLRENGDKKKHPWSLKININRRRSQAQLSFKIPVLPPALRMALADHLEENSQSGIFGRIVVGQDKNMPYLIHFGGRISSRDIRFKNDFIASKSVTLQPSHLSFEAVYNSSNQDLYFRKLRFSAPTSNNQQSKAPKNFVSLSGKAGITNLGNSKPSKLFLQLSLANTPCDKVRDAFPIGFAGSLQQFNLAGTMSGTFEFATSLSNLNQTKIKTPKFKMDCRIEPRTRRFSLLAFNWDKKGKKKPQAILHKTRRLPYIAMRDLPKYIPHAFVASEDVGFFDHDGFEIKELARALATNLGKGSIKRGGSTITQQTAKNLWLSSERTLSRKVAEIFLSQYLEQTLDKEKILEVYLNLIEFGPNVYGIENAARTYFSKAAARLSLPETVFLTGLIPAPKKRFVRACRRAPTANVIALLHGRYERMHRAGFISAPDAHAAKQSPLRFALSPRFKELHCRGTGLDLAKPKRLRSHRQNSRAL